ncbi:aromatic ring-hydroxylating dioxygenase subunit alpha [Aquincola sp. S2]|uniref:Aromatic ring-hydroxylating dioxygenase subunit alpha n=1 Tax=Pseudaquabacterium terrae TaxID=2732868 RepID=A0ABX2ESC7_9BURK|nr:aromatic ring-hydroxylating dioxygenase subunit alpha [Aquabacterium terrae]NRF71599.1 aromatic ring-hydroxylating dioxygenase subunit alpha [Aquabacterium terrae]
MNHPLEAPLPATLAGMIDRLDQQRRSGRRETGDAAGSLPTRRYTDPAHWQREQAALFGQWPVVAAHSSELPAGSALAFDALGVPIVLTRSAEDGRARAFFNVCRHRGMALVAAGAGSEPAQAKPCKALVCPYHAWTYELDGRLRHRLHAETFDGIDPAMLNLVELPCDETAGLIFVQRTPGPAISAAAFLQGLDEHLQWLGLAGMTVFRKVDRTYAANWKLTADAFLEGYHIRVLHRDTIYPFFADAFVVNLHAGPHQDSLVARRAAFEAFEPPRDRVALCKLASPTQLLFPNTFLIWHPDYVSLIGMFSPAVDQVRWVHTMLIPPERSGADWTPHWEKTFRLIEQTVFQQEDIGTAVAIQRGLASGANTTMQLGRLEHEVLRFHRGIDAAIDGTLLPFSAAPTESSSAPPSAAP